MSAPDGYVRVPCAVCGRPVEVDVWSHGEDAAEGEWVCARCAGRR